MALLIGDSILNRLYHRYHDSYNSESANFCISGGKVAKVKGWVKDHIKLVGTNVAILLVGVNDLIKPHTFSMVWNSYVSLINLLLRHNFKVYIVKILPIANYMLNVKFKKVIAQFNFQMLSLSQKPGVSLIDLSSIFLDANKDPISKLYCARIGNRVDYLHPNNFGLRAMNGVLSALH